MSRIIACVAIAGFVYSDYALGAAEGGPAAPGLLRSLAGLAAVLILIFALAWLARKFTRTGGPGAASEGRIRVLAQQALGLKEKLVLIEVDGKRLLVGITPGQAPRCLVQWVPEARERPVPAAGGRQ